LVSAGESSAGKKLSTAKVNGAKSAMKDKTANARAAGRHAEIRKTILFMI